MLLNDYLNESGYSIIEATNEGYDFEFGGMEDVIDLAESDMTKLAFADIISQVQICNAINENTDIEPLQENAIKSFFEKVKSIIKKMAARVMEVLNSAKLHFQKIFMKNKFIENANKILKDYNGSVEIEGYNYTVNYDSKKMYETYISKVEKKINDAINAGDNAKTTLENNTNAEAVDTIVEESFGSKESEIKTYMFKTLRNGNDSTETIKVNCSSVLNSLKSQQYMISNIDKIKTEISNMYKSAISTVDGLQKEAEKSNDNNKSFKIEAYKKQSTLLTKGLNIANMTVNARLVAIKDNVKQAKSAAMKLISQKKKEDRKENVNASTNIFDMMFN